jgi:histidyl-tRNA synthetase
MSDKKKLIQPRTLKGFRDFPPALAMPREQMIDKARAVFRSYGFAPIDTPALEYAEILTGKGGDESDKQMYRFSDNGGRDVALRFDLTVPFARFAAQHIGQLGTPFKRYHVGPVWRGENTQHGRYREFYQCDFDTIGTDANAADIETALVIHDILSTLGFERFSIHVNHRLVLNGLLESLGLVEGAPAILRALDKLAKIGEEKVAAEMQSTANVAPEQAQKILETVQIKGSNSEILAQLDDTLGDHERAAAGIANLRQLVAAFTAANIPENRLALDVSIARGLDYYTGTVYETLLDDLPGIGSICSGGRYDDLAGLYTKQHLPGVGASLGLDRLMAAMEELGLLQETIAPADIFIAQFVEESLAHYIATSRRLRIAGLRAELYPEAKGLGKQLKYADRKNIPLALIGGPNEFEKGVWQVKDLRSGTSEEVADKDLVAHLQGQLK